MRSEAGVAPVLEELSPSISVVATGTRLGYSSVNDGFACRVDWTYDGSASGTDTYTFRSEIQGGPQTRRQVVLTNSPIVLWEDSGFRLVFEPRSTEPSDGSGAATPSEGDGRETE
jgi:hypothetical protein